VSSVPPPEIAVSLPTVVAPPPDDAVPSWKVHTVFFGQLIFRKIIKTVATRRQIVRLKFYFDWGSAQSPLG